MIVITFYQSIFLHHINVIISIILNIFAEERCFKALFQSSDVNIIKKGVFQGLFCTQPPCWFKFQQHFHQVVCFSRQIRYKSCEISGRPYRVQMDIFINELAFLEGWIIKQILSGSSQCLEYSQNYLYLRRLLKRMVTSYQVVKYTANSPYICSRRIM